VGANWRSNYVGEGSKKKAVGTTNRGDEKVLRKDMRETFGWKSFLLEIRGERRSGKRIEDE